MMASPIMVQLRGKGGLHCGCDVTADRFVGELILIAVFVIGALHGQMSNHRNAPRS